MKISEVTVFDVADYLKIDICDIEPQEKRELEAILEAAKVYIKNETGLNAEECDEHEDLTLACFILCSDFYENRGAYVAASEASPSETLKSILGFHRVNLL